MIIHRIISAILLICIIAPVHIVIAILYVIFNFFNNLHYANFWQFEMPKELTDKIGHGNTIAEAMMRISCIIVIVCKNFKENIAQLKSCKF